MTAPSTNNQLVSIIYLSPVANLFLKFRLQNRNLQLKMAATRLGKEASDLYAVKKQPVILSRGDLIAKATVQRVVVYNNDRCLCRVEK
ncbi:hypothetical protein FOL80_09505 [Lactobacillus reuteri]|nr:hypothetical protein [Limosilactobacillus reuteri]NMV60593.1 hypothetical protein [Limosilactobacillus reuteri]NMV62383.1 hypothetical protein [Limosilactobacillus reuteri]NMV64156.1 hypothetical protein [Limosilactobacillus reuteri]NMV67746.1 hypothetical protein [Limosilactobacillus reuteri]